jgi:hypothetical protein
MPRRTGTGTTQLRAVIAELRRQDNLAVTRQMRRELAATARPFVPRIRAAILNIPSGGGVPYRQPPGLRARIADCVQTWATGGTQDSPVVRVGVEVNSALMPDGQKSLPLYMDGVKPRWRHPLFGDTEHWYAQGNAPHPYFYASVGPLGPASRVAIERVAEDIKRQIG